jgi:hypothetical protein
MIDTKPILDIVSSEHAGAITYERNIHADQIPVQSDSDSDNERSDGNKSDPEVLNHEDEEEISEVSDGLSTKMLKKTKIGEIGIIKFLKTSKLLPYSVWRIKIRESLSKYLVRFRWCI